MENYNRADIVAILNSFKKNQPFTIEQLISQVGSAKGREWTLFKLQEADTLEKYLLQEQLIQEFNTVKQYTKV